MELRQFRYFVAVAEELHFSRAAQRLNIGQPPLTLQIQSIERELGVALLKRNRRKVELTEAGRLFLDEARAALAQAARAVETAKRAARGEVGTLRLSFTTSAPMLRVFTRAVRHYRAIMPDVHLELRIQTSQQILDGLLLEKIDLGFIRPAASAVIPKGIEAIPVVTDRLMLALPAQHALAAVPEPVPLGLLAGVPFVLRPRGTGAGFYEQVFELCHRAGFVPSIAQEASEAPTILGLVAAGLGVTIAPASLQAMAVEDIVWRELDLGPEALSSILLVIADKQPSGIRSSFVKVVREMVEAERRGWLPQAGSAM
ncbi:LysR family transcriptional regulator [Prosthecomicrobium sp. N25]|uniref:LysR family transcriptional regulator n=1 Tax=Prosthecomicrobium sp. N25 TaxID=3129254 RepID=UPI003076B805